MRRGISIAVGLTALISLAGLLIAVFLPEPPPPPGAPHVQQLYMSFCASCHGPSGSGSWRSTLFLIRPGNLADRSRMRGLTDQYFFDLIKHGGAPIGKPGMPGFSFHLTDAEIEELVAYVRSLSAAR
jgi:mono/diheme cytochrome c family protein